MPQRNKAFVDTQSLQMLLIVQTLRGHNLLFSKRALVVPLISDAIILPEWLEMSRSRDFNIHE